tara:strand:- start:346 stop:1392 length:1047 start_codon:yes stop_codon:yes gene_type:complete
MNKMNFTIMLCVFFIFTGCDNTSNVSGPNNSDNGSNSYIFVAGEGNFNSPGSGSISMIDEYGNISILDEVGTTVQSVEVYNDNLLVSMNGDQKILVYNINTMGIEYSSEILMGNQSPRDIMIIDDRAYITAWNPAYGIYSTTSGFVKVLNLNSFEIEETIEVGIMPEGMLYSGGFLWVANSGESSVSKINIESNLVSSIYEVGSGPQFLAGLNDEIYIARTFYDLDWNPAYGTSKISSAGVNQIDHVFAAGSACGGSVLSLNNKVYRSFDGGIAQIDDNLEIDVLNRIGSFNQSNVYHIEVIDGNILFALADYADLNQVHVLNQYGETIAEYEVGSTPGDFTFWKKSE